MKLNTTFMKYTITPLPIQPVRSKARDFFHCIPLLLMFVLAPFASAAPCGEIVRNVVTYYGVDPADSKLGVAFALSDAEAYLVANPEDTLVLYFPANTYDFHNTTGEGIKISNFTSGNLVLRGDGPDLTHLVFHEQGDHAIAVFNSDYLTIEQMHITRPQISTTQGEVVSVAPGEVVFNVHSGFPDPVDYFYQGLGRGELTLLPFDGSDPLDPKYHPVSEKIKLMDMIDLGSGQYRAVLKNANTLPALVAGDWVALKSKNGGQGIRVVNGSHLLLQQLRFTNHFGTPIRLKNEEAPIVRFVNIDRRGPVNGRVPCFSGPGGGIQLNTASTAAIVHDCTVVGTADDGIAIFSSDSENLTSGAIVEGNTVRDNQARAILITQSINGVCRNNTIIRSEKSSIQIKMNEGAEGVPSASVQDWKIVNNTIIEKAFNEAIGFDAEKVADGKHNNVEIAYNTFIDASPVNHIIKVDHVDTVMIHDNVVQSFRAPADADNSAGTTNAFVYVKNGLSVTGSGNKYLEATARADWEKQVAEDLVSVVWDFAVAPLQPVFTDDPINLGDVFSGAAINASIAAYGFDADGDTLTYALQSGGPAWLGVDSDGVLLGMPSNADAGSNTWTVELDDGTGPVTATLNINVIVNNDPEFTERPIVKPNGLVGVAYPSESLGEYVIDADGDALCITKLTGPAWLTVDNRGELSGTPGAADSGMNHWGIEVSDGFGGTDKVRLKIMVDSQN